VSPLFWAGLVCGWLEKIIVLAAFLSAAKGPSLQSKYRFFLM
jgi:F0F1-type ATP synthase membrane subunit c/vacuolar-type H+-ATPase subunit K